MLCKLKNLKVLVLEELFDLQQTMGEKALGCKLMPYISNVDGSDGGFGALESAAILPPAG